MLFLCSTHTAAFFQVPTVSSAFLWCKSVGVPEKSCRVLDCPLVVMFSDPHIGGVVVLFKTHKNLQKLR